MEWSVTASSASSYWYSVLPMFVGGDSGQLWMSFSMSTISMTGSRYFIGLGTSICQTPVREGRTYTKIGEEAVQAFATWSLDRPGLQELRYLVRRFLREPHRFEVLAPPLPDGMVEELADFSDEWLSLPGRREHGFTQGQFARASVRSTPVALTRDPTGKVVAFANLVLSEVPGQATIDSMRRRHQPYGSMDVLLALLFQRLRDQGYTSFSLGLVPLSGVDLPLVGTDPIREHFFRLIKPFFSVQGLRHFKAKFDPRWEPRFLVFRSVSALPLLSDWPC